MKSFFTSLPRDTDFNDFIQDLAKNLDIKLEEYRSEDWTVDTEQKENRIQEKTFFKFLVDENHKNFEEFSLRLSLRLKEYAK